MSTMQPTLLGFEIVKRRKHQTASRTDMMATLNYGGERLASVIREAEWDEGKGKCASMWIFADTVKMGKLFPEQDSGDYLRTNLQRMINICCQERESLQGTVDRLTAVLKAGRKDMQLRSGACHWWGEQ